MTPQPQWGQMLPYQTLPSLAPARLTLLLPFVKIPGTWARKRRGQNPLQASAVPLPLGADSNLF